VVSPAKFVGDGVSKIIEIRSLYKDNEQYKKERLIESKSFQELVSLKLKIAEYEKLLNINKDLDYNFITSRVTADLSKKYFSSVLVNVGKKDGVFENMPITGPNGLLGKITDVDQSISRGMLVTDVSSRIAVSISEENFQGILIGQNQKNPKIDFVKELAQVIIGDLVTTSGKGGIFPPYIIVGQIVKKGKDYLEVELFEDIDSLSHIRLLNFNNNISNDF
jgi:rod shape-determining protein MreC